MAVRTKRRVTSVGKDKQIIGGKVTITSAGAISSQDGVMLSGGTATKTNAKTGRYAIAFYRTFKRVHSVSAFMIGPDDSAFPTTTGSQIKGRLLSTSGFSVQFVREDTQADAEPASGTVFTWSAIVSLI